MNGASTWDRLFQVLAGVLQWTVVVVSVAATVALFGWILMMIFKKDKAK